MLDKDWSSTRAWQTRECMQFSTQLMVCICPVQAFTLVLAICLSIGSPKPSAVFSVSPLAAHAALDSLLICPCISCAVYSCLARPCEAANHTDTASACESRHSHG